MTMKRERCRVYLCAKVHESYVSLRKGRKKGEQEERRRTSVARGARKGAKRMREMSRRRSQLAILVCCLACHSFCLAMQASLASGVMSTLITDRLCCDVLEYRESKEKSIATCRRRDGDGKREKADRGQVARSARKGERTECVGVRVWWKIHGGLLAGNGAEGRGRTSTRENQTFIVARCSRTGLSFARVRLGARFLDDIRMFVTD